MATLVFTRPALMRTIRGCALGAVVSLASGAQAPAGSAHLTPAAVAESLSVLRELDRAVRARPDDGAAWYRRGVVAWALAERARHGDVPHGLRWQVLFRMADTSLRRATFSAPANPQYRVAFAKLRLTSTHFSARAIAPGEIGEAYEASKASADSQLRSEAAIEAARVHWRRYDRLRDRHLLVGDADVERTLLDLTQNVVKHSNMLGTLADISMPRAGGDLELFNIDVHKSSPLANLADVYALLRRVLLPLPDDVNGAIDHAKASALFGEAYALAPASARAFRSYAMLLADGGRWRELEAFAREHLRASPRDAAALMVLGLALQRRDRSDAAHTAFAAGLQLHVPAERARLDALERVLAPTDTAGYGRATADEKFARRYAYWLGADRLWSQPGNEAHVEFLARVTFAELRWTVDELGVRGADTDRGDVYIRYGPPDFAASIGPKAVYGESSEVVTFWLYDSGLMFSFVGIAGYATARTPTRDQSLAETYKTLQPARWDNLAKTRVDSMVVQVARFRAAHDSVDVLIAANPHYDSIRASSDVNQPVLGAVWLLAGGTRLVFGDTTRIDDARVLAWTRRVAQGEYLYRIEASATGGARASRAMAVVTTSNDERTGFANVGFGVSDILLASHSELEGPGARWTTAHTTPMAGAIAAGRTLSILWENYEFGERAAVANYTVSITVDRDRTARGQLAMQLVGVPADVARIDRSADRFVVSFDRLAAHAVAFADVVRLDLGHTPIGSYRLTLSVRDNVSGRSVVRSTNFVVRGD